MSEDQPVRSGEPVPPVREERPQVVTPRRVVAGICIVIPFVALLWVNSYSRMTPQFIGIPFFYWYQIAWVPVTAALTYVAYVLVRAEERAQRARKEGASR